MELDYDQMLMLDAEDLAEQGIKEAYDSLLPLLRRHVAEPLEVEERLDEETGRYVVSSGGKEYVIYDPENTEESSWGRATFVLFSIVNSQLARSDYRLFAINGGNDHGGFFLTQAQAVQVRTSLPRRTDWPHIPDESPPWFGQVHSDDD